MVIDSVLNNKSMIEVFKTNVNHLNEAEMLIAKIKGQFEYYTANFDLEDCDRILRVVSTDGSIQASSLIEIVNNAGFTAVVLQDD
jgi:hypothetical protein